MIPGAAQGEPVLHAYFDGAYTLAYRQYLQRMPGGIEWVTGTQGASERSERCLRCYRALTPHTPPVSLSPSRLRLACNADIVYPPTAWAAQHA